MKVKEEKTSGASPSDKAMVAIQPHKPNHEVAASVDAAAHGQSSAWRFWRQPCCYDVCKAFAIRVRAHRM